MKKYLELIRIKHWIKNILIFVPSFYAKIFTIENFWLTIQGFIAFSFTTSFVYIINDIRDLEKDKLHFRKKKRPLPSGRITVRQAFIVAVFLLIISLLINTYINKSINNLSLCFLITYLFLNIAYSFGLKNVAIIDILILAAGFILRIYYGAAITNVVVSDWLFLTILNASLFLGLGKRRKEITNNKDVRKVLEEYNEAFLDKFQYLTLGLTLVFYSLWTIEQDIKYLFLTIPLIMIIFMKYSLIIEKSDEGDPTTIIYQDKILLLLCIIYAVSMIVFMTIM